MQQPKIPPETTAFLGKTNTSVPASTILTHVICEGSKTWTNKKSTIATVLSVGRAVVGRADLNLLLAVVLIEPLAETILHYCYNRFS